MDRAGNSLGWDVPDSRLGIIVFSNCEREGEKIAGQTIQSKQYDRMDKPAKNYICI